MTATNPPDREEHVSLGRDGVLGKCDFFVDVHLWQLRESLNPKGWLENFTATEQAHALYLLDSFTFFSDELVDALFIAAFQQLSTHAVPTDQPYLAAQAAWNQFCKNVIIAHVEGEQPNAADSGYAFARRARQLLQIDESHILSPGQTLATLVQENRQRPVVFVDDFVGTGNQFATTWSRMVPLPGRPDYSFAQYSRTQGGKFYYCPLVCTDYGYRRLRRDCREVELLPVHLLDAKRDGALAPESRVWPDRLRPSAEGFLRNASDRAGIPMGGKDCWKGFGDLGLTLAFEHSVPDATLPIFYWEKSGWIPLIRRR
jgi:hypothetical protein